MSVWEGRVPGKVFLLGEYAALFGLPAIVATVPHYFKMNALERAVLSYAGGPSEIHPESPLGRLLKSEPNLLSDERVGWLDFKDPFAGEGGFGASTAQFALGYALALQLGLISEGSEASGDPIWLRAWRTYRSLMADGAGGIVPSGADLVAQIVGGVVCFEWKEKPQVEKLRCLADAALPAVSDHCLIFSATSDVQRKVPTHCHLAQGDLKCLFEGASGRDVLSQLETLTRRGRQAWIEGAVRSFGETVSEYGNILDGIGLQCDAMRADRIALSELEGVVGTKGTGALQSDGLLVVMEDPVLLPGSGATSQFQKGSQISAQQKIVEVAASRGLKWVAGGLQANPGLFTSMSGLVQSTDFSERCS